MSRRALLGAAGLGLAGGGFALGAATGAHESEEVSSASVVPFYGRHQAGIATPPPEHVLVAAFDFESDDAGLLRDLLIDWTAVAARLTNGRNASQHQLQGAPDPGEAADLAATSLTLTFGFGPSLFELDGQDRMGLAGLRPSPLENLPYFRGDAIDPKRSGGDVCVQACADSAQVAFHAIHVLARAALGAATLRWAQAGFRGAARRDENDPRNLMGFKDGTANVDRSDPHALTRSVWVGPGDQTWMRDGSYAVIRRVRMLLDSWDALSLGGQERSVGRRKATGAPLAHEPATDRPDLDARNNGELTIPSNAHIRLASAAPGDGPPPLRRSYSFVDGIDATTGQIDAGLVFIAFQRNPAKQFTPIQRRLAANDAMSDHLQHTSSAVFACPPGTRPGGYIGERLFAKL